MKYTFKGRKAAQGQRDNIHKDVTRRNWDDVRIQQTIISRIISKVGLFTNNNKGKNLDA